MDEGNRQSEDVKSEETKQLSLPLVQQDLDESSPPRSTVHLVFYIAIWVSLSSATILFNKYVLTTRGFDYPILLTCWHMGFGTVMTQLLARYTHMLDSRKTVPMTGRLYLRSVAPIGVLLSLCLMGGNSAYLYLTVSFIQILKASMPVVTILVSWAMGYTPLSLQTTANVSFIVFGVMIASYGEVQLVMIGVIIQCSAVVFDALRLVATQRLLTTSMDSLVLVYYLSPLCALINAAIALLVEIPRMTLASVLDVGIPTLVANASVAFALNIATVVLISKTSSLAMTLCGLFKNILTVLASILFFGDQVSGLQAFGYSIALLGLLYYQLGGVNIRADRIKQAIGRGVAPVKS